MKKLAIMVLLFAASLASAQEYSGIWNGVGGKVDSHYGTVPATAQMTLIQAGTSLKGTIKLGNGKPVAITSGTVSGTQLTVVIVNSSFQMTGNLSQSGSQLTGKMTSSSGTVYNFVFTQGH